MATAATGKVADSIAVAVWTGFEEAGSTRPRDKWKERAAKLARVLDGLARRYRLSLSSEHITQVARMFHQSATGKKGFRAKNPNRVAQQRSALAHARKVLFYLREGIPRPRRYADRLASLRAKLDDPVIHTQLAMTPNAEIWMKRVYSDPRSFLLRPHDLIHLIAALEGTLATSSGRSGRPRGYPTRVATLAMLIWRDSGRKERFTWDEVDKKLKGPTAEFVFRFVRILGTRISHQNLKALMANAKDDLTLH